MTQETATILVVDDDPILLDIHTLYLQDEGYKTLTAENGRQAFQLVEKSPDSIDAILSDVLMPEMDGYELCQLLKSSSNDLIKSIPFIFISSLTDLDEKLKGYSVGGDDYVTKPVEPAELTQKLNHVIETKKIQQSLNQQISESFNTAMQAMTYSSELGQTLEFFRESLNAENFEELALSLFKVTNSYELNCTLQIHTGDSVLNFNNSGNVTPLEANVIQLARAKQRFYDFGTRTVINYDDFSLLIKNMPLDDTEKYGRYKDTLGTLCNAIEAKISSLLKDNRVLQLNDILATLQSTMDEIDAAFNNIQNQNVAAIEKMMRDTENAVIHLGLMEYQEENILNIAQSCLDKTKEVFYQGIALNDRFEEIRNKLTNSIKK